MEKEEKVVVVLLTMIILSLSIAYVFFFSDTGPELAEFSGSSEIGERVMLEGNVISKLYTHTGGHLLLTVNSRSGPVMVFIPSSSGAEEIGSRVKRDDTVQVSGIVQDYNGRIEVVVRNEKDVFVIDTA